MCLFSDTKPLGVHIIKRTRWPASEGSLDVFWRNIRRPEFSGRGSSQQWMKPHTFSSTVSEKQRTRSSSFCLRPLGCSQHGWRVLKNDLPLLFLHSVLLALLLWPWVLDADLVDSAKWNRKHSPHGFTLVPFVLTGLTRNQNDDNQIFLQTCFSKFSQRVGQVVSSALTVAKCRSSLFYFFPLWQATDRHEQNTLGGKLQQVCSVTGTQVLHAIESKMLPCSMQTGAKKKKKSFSKSVCWQNSGQSVELIVCLFDVLTMFCMHGVEVKPERPDWDSLSRGGTEVGSGRSCRQQISGSGDEVSWWERRGAEGWMAAADWLKVNGWEEKKRPVASASC